MSGRDGVLFRSVRLRHRRMLVDVRVEAGRVAAIDTRLDPGPAVVVHGEGGVLLPGLHDHHCHLLAAASAQTSVACGPPEVQRHEELSAALSRAPVTEGWVRGVGYDTGVAGDLDAAALDVMRADVPVRVQHRSGALWVLNSLAVQLLDLDGSAVEGVERDGRGRPTGRLWRADGWLRERLAAPATPNLAAVSEALAAVGVTGVTDATPDLDAAAEAALRSVPQRVLLLGASGDGPHKIVVDDHDLPTFPELVGTIRAARPRPVAVHSVTRVSLLLTLAALREVGTLAGDRIEHAAVAPPEAAQQMAALGLTVITQPSLVARRGDDYLARVAPEDLPWLWPFRSLLDAGVSVACSSDAPYGSLDPWASIRAATSRRAPSGRQVAVNQVVEATVALDGYLTPLSSPGRRPRLVEVGMAADLVLLDRPLDEMLRHPDARAVRMTLIDGEQVHAS